MKTTQLNPRIVQEIFEEVKNLEDGKVASYIPELQKADPASFGVSVCTLEGEQYGWGDTNALFSVQSVTKPLNYCLAQELLGCDAVHEYIGFEPSGHGFNEMTLDGNNLPHNPMINAGGITSCYLIQRQTGKKALNKVLGTWGKISGQGEAEISGRVFHSEKDTGHRNYALAHFLMDHGVFQEDADIHKITEFYFQTCSTLVNAESLSLFAATLANRGRHPLSGEQLFHQETVRNCLSMMLSCGMYDYSGTFAFQVGLPAKCGVSGGLILSIPGCAGIGIWSPPLDHYGNSVRAVAFCQKLATRLKLHIFD